VDHSCSEWGSCRAILMDLIKVCALLTGSSNFLYFVLKYGECVEIKCHLDATDDFYCRSYCLFNMFRAPLCPSSGAREYYTGGCCLWYLVLWFSSCQYGVELRVMCPVCGQLLQQPANRTHDDGHSGARNMLSKQ
jgi:hypothetical protein